MNVGVCRVELRLLGNQSLKGKRRAVRLIVTRLRNSYNVSVAEVGNQGLWWLATLGMICVTHHRRRADEVLSSVVRFVAQGYPDLELLGSGIEISPAF